MAFAFTPEQRERLFDALGHSDSGPWHLVEDVEKALEAYGNAELALDAGATAALGVDEFQQTLTQIAQLRAGLYALPERARRLAALGEVPDDVLADLDGLANASGEALERLAVRLAALSVSAPSPVGPYAMAERFVHSVGKAFRNRLNTKPTTDAKGLFRRFLDVLIDLVRRRHADLDDLSKVLTEERLKQILWGAGK